MKYSVLFDVDGVLNDLIGDTLEEAHKRFGMEITREQITEYDVRGCLRAEEASALDIIWSDPEFVNSLTPVEAAAAHLAWLAHKGVDIYIMTNCRPDVMPGRSRWLATYFPFIPADHVVYGAPKHRFTCDFIVEDCMETLLDCPCWIHKICVDTPYNAQPAEVDERRHIVRVADVGGACDAIMTIIEEEEKDWQNIR